METKMLSCFICGVSRSSKFALKRHQRKEHPSAGTTATRRVEGTVTAVTATSSQPSTSDTRSVVTAHQSESMRGRHDPRRPAVDRIVRELQSRYRQNPAYLRKSSAEIASDLRRGTRPQANSGGIPRGRSYREVLRWRQASARSVCLPPCSCTGSAS